MGKLEVIRADYAGACYGVQRALDITLKAAAGTQSVSTLGPLIHNPRVVSNLDAAGVHVANTPAEITTQSVVIRSHGVVPSVLACVEARGVEILDATCPHVKRAQKAAQTLAREGRHVIVVGEAGHPEVEGISAHAQLEGAACTVVATAAELPANLEGPVGVVVQTTQSRAKLEEVLAALNERGLDVAVKDTICFATTQRQTAAIELAKCVDAMVVLGGRNSSNTTRLFEICSAHCARVFHVESAGEITPEWFEGCTRVGITAGASTPDGQIAEAISVLEAL